MGAHVTILPYLGVTPGLGASQTGTEKKVPPTSSGLTCGAKINPLRLIAGTIGTLRICNYIIPVKPRRFEAPFRQEFCLIKKVW